MRTRLLLTTALLLVPTVAQASCGFGSSIAGGQCRGYILQGTTSFPVPSDFTSTNSFEAIGPGGTGATSTGGTTAASGGSGQGGGYGRVKNVASGASGYGTAGSTSLTVQVGAHNTTNPTFVENASSSVIAQGDYGASGSGVTGGAHSQTNTGADLTKTGGAGANGVSSGVSAEGGPGGGGAGGPGGNGAAGTATATAGAAGGSAAAGGSSGAAGSGSNGGAGGNDTTSANGGTGGTTGNHNGGNGTPAATVGGAGGGGGFSAGAGVAGTGGTGASGEDWDSTHGSGGGGGGGGASAILADAGLGGPAGCFGGGGGGAGSDKVSGGSGAAGGAGCDGIIVVTYTPVNTGFKHSFGTVFGFANVTTPPIPPPSNYQIVAGGGMAATIEVSGYEQSQTSFPLYITCNGVTSIEAVDWNGNLQGTNGTTAPISGEVASPNAANIQYSIQPAGGGGPVTQFTFNGSAALFTVAGGGTAFSDPLTGTWTAGAYQMRDLKTVAATNNKFMNGTYNAGNAGATPLLTNYRTTPGGSQLLNTTAMNATGGTNITPQGTQPPMMLLGLTPNNCHSFLVVGDSHPFGGPNDWADAYGRYGWAQQGFASDPTQAASYVPWANWADPGDWLHDLVLWNTIRLGLGAPYSKNVLIYAMPHDIQGQETVAQVEADLKTIWADYKAYGLHVYQALNPPQTTDSVDTSPVFGTYTNQEYVGGWVDPADSPCTHCNANHPVGSYPCASTATSQVCDYTAATVDAFVKASVGTLIDGYYDPKAAWGGGASGWPWLYAAGTDCPLDPYAPSSIQTAQPAGTCSVVGTHPNANANRLGAVMLYNLLQGTPEGGSTWTIN